MIENPPYEKLEKLWLTPLTNEELHRLGFVIHGDKVKPVKEVYFPWAPSRRTAGIPQDFNMYTRPTPADLFRLFAEAVRSDERRVIRDKISQQAIEAAGL